MEENKEYKFDAFISYRHCELDKFVAENLHKILESYELPRNVKKKLNIKSKTIKRVFRDQEELPLSSNLEDPIIDALENSKYLIVICSPRLKDSLWCKKEIETFKKLRGRKNIFCVLVEGEPCDSFPEEVLYDEKEVTLENGEVKIEKYAVEPLAADVRGENKKEVLKKIKEEKLRLIAPMYKLDYDDLKQRHKLRRQKRIMNTSIIVATACFIFALYTSAMLIKINSQQETLKLHQALSLSSNAEEYLKKDNRYDAVKSSYEALTEFEGVNMPYTSEAEYALVESLGLYDAGYAYKAISEIKTKGVADYIKSSEDNKYAAVYDESGEITLFETNTLKIVTTYSVKDSLINEKAFSFIGNDKLSFINADGNISIVNVENGNKVAEIEKEGHSYYSVRGNSTGEYLTYTDRKNVYIYDVNENKKIGQISSEDDFLKDLYFSENSDYVFAGSIKVNYDITVEDSLTLHVIDVKEAKEINNMTFVASTIGGIETRGDTAYLLLNNGATINSVNMQVISCNFINGNINWENKFERKFGKFLVKSYAENSNNIVVVNNETTTVLNGENGAIEATFNSSNNIINIYTFINKEVYLVFASDGTVEFINMERKESYEYGGKFELNLDAYSAVCPSEKGFLLMPQNGNRIILYEEKTNKEIKEVDIEVGYPENQSVLINEQKSIIEEYDVNNKNLVNNIFYDTNKEVVFVVYANNDIAIYSVKDKTLLKTLNNVGEANHYFGKDKENRIYIGEITNSFILDKDYNLVGHINGLRKIDGDKVIISNNEKLYSIKIYGLKDILEIAKEYLK